MLRVVGRWAPTTRAWISYCMYWDIFLFTICCSLLERTKSSRFCYLSSFFQGVPKKNLYSILTGFSLLVTLVYHSFGKLYKLDKCRNLLRWVSVSLKSLIQFFLFPWHLYLFTEAILSTASEYCGFYEAFTVVYGVHQLSCSLWWLYCFVSIINYAQELGLEVVRLVILWHAQFLVFFDSVNLSTKFERIRGHLKSLLSIKH